MLVILDNGTIFIDDMQNLVGHGSSEAERKAGYRKRIDALKLLGQCPGQSPPELSKDKLEKEIKIKKEKEKRFQPPSIQEIQSFLDDNSITNINAENFYHYYEAQDWLLSNGKKMKKWESAIHRWKNNNFNKPEKKEETPEERQQKIKENLGL